MTDDTKIEISADAASVERAAVEAEAALDGLQDKVKEVGEAADQSGEFHATRFEMAWTKSFKQIKRAFSDLMIPFAVGGMFTSMIVNFISSLEDAQVKALQFTETIAKSHAAAMEKLSAITTRETSAREKAVSQAQAIALAERNRALEEHQKKALEIASKSTYEQAKQFGSNTALFSDEEIAEIRKRAAKAGRTAAEEYGIYWIEKLDSTRNRASLDLETRLRQELARINKEFDDKEAEEREKKAEEEAKKQADDERRANQQAQQEEERVSQARAREEQEARRLERDAAYRAADEELRLRMEVTDKIADLENETTLDPDTHPAVIVERKRLALIGEYLSKLEEVRRKQAKQHDEDMKRLKEKSDKELEAAQRLRDELKKMRDDQAKLGQLMLEGMSGESQFLALSQFIRARGR